MGPFPAYTMWGTPLRAGRPFCFESICINVEEGLGSWGAGSLRKVGVGRAFQGPMDKRPNCVGKCSLSQEQKGSLSQGA